MDELLQKFKKKYMNTTSVYNIVDKLYTRKYNN